MQEDQFQKRKLGDLFKVKGSGKQWKVAYYPINENGETNEDYPEPRALMETPIEGGIDFREMPLRYVEIVKN